MKTKCDKCDNPATVHLTEILNGQKIEKHLCADCAAEEGITIKANVPITQLLEEFVQQAPETEPQPPDLECDVCGMTLSEFRDTGRLGCPNDYEAFSSQLVGMIAQAQDTATQHVGKVPHRAGSDQQKQTAVLRLRSELRQSIQREDYERAAVLRDQIKELDNA